MSRYIFFGLVLILVFLVVRYSPWHEGFDDVPANDTVGQHMNYINQSKVKFDTLTNTVNLTSPSIGIDPINAANVKQALTTLQAHPTSSGYTLTSTAPYVTPQQLPATIAIAQQCEAAPRSLSLIHI